MYYDLDESEGRFFIKSRSDVCFCYDVQTNITGIPFTAYPISVGFLHLKFWGLFLSISYLKKNY